MSDFEFFMLIMIFGCSVATFDCVVQSKSKLGKEN